MTVPSETLLIFTYQFFCLFFSLHQTFAPEKVKRFVLVNILPSAVDF